MKKTKLPFEKSPKDTESKYKEGSKKEEALDRMQVKKTKKK
jgi:hypothetical protein